MQRVVVCLVVGALLALVPITPLFAQGALSEVNGTAADQSGAVLPGVTVTLTEETTGLVRTVITNEAGRWVLPGAAAGRYTVKAELSGFQTQNRTGVVVNVGQAVTLNLALPVGGLSDQVTVTGEAPLVEVTQTQVGTNITGQNIDALPTAGRQQYALLQLVPGLTPTLAAGSFEGAQYSAGGQSTSNNVFMVDGAYNNDDRTQSGPGMQTRMTVDTTAEYQVLVHDFGAEYGGAAGAVINAVTKGGSNQFHGRAAYYLQDSKLDATNYFLKLAGSTPAKSGVKTMLANIGGPIIQNKMFFFANVERLRIRQAADLLYPKDAAPLAVSYSTFLPVGSENYFGRVDYQINQSNNVSVRAVFDVNRVNGQDHVVQLRTIQAMRIERVPRPGETFINGQWLRVMGNRMVNEFRMHRVNENLQVGDQRMFDNVGSNTIFKDNQFLGLKGDQLDFGSGPGAPRLRDGALCQPGRGERHDHVVHRAVDVYADQAHLEARRRREQERRRQHRRDQLHRVVLVCRERRVRPGQSLDLSESFCDPARRAVSPDARLAHELLRVGQVAGHAHAHPEPGGPIRLSGRSPADEECVLAAARHGARSQRADADPGGRRQVLPVSVDGHSRQPLCGRGECPGLHLRYRSGQQPRGRTAADERRLPAAGEQWRPGGDQPRVPGATGGGSHLGELGRLREHRAGARRQSPPAISVVLRRRGPARNLHGNGA